MWGKGVSWLFKLRSWDEVVWACMRWGGKGGLTAHPLCYAPKVKSMPPHFVECRLGYPSLAILTTLSQRTQREKRARDIRSAIQIHMRPFPRMYGALLKIPGCECTDDHKYWFHLSFSYLFIYSFPFFFFTPETPAWIQKKLVSCRNHPLCTLTRGCPGRCQSPCTQNRRHALDDCLRGALPPPPPPPHTSDTR
jgi:hypothetical protein